MELCFSAKTFLLLLLFFDQKYFRIILFFLMYPLINNSLFYFVLFCSSFSVLFTGISPQYSVRWCHVSPGACLTVCCDSKHYIKFLVAYTQ